MGSICSRKHEKDFWSYVIKIFQKTLNHCNRFTQSAKPGSEKAWLLKLFFTIGRLFGVMFVLFFDHREHFGSAGRPLLMPRSGSSSQKCPRRRHPQNNFAFWDRFGNYFWICFYLLDYVFEHFFCRALGFICHGFGLHFDTLCWHLFTLVRAFDFDDMLQLLNSKTRFSKVRGHCF